MKKPTIRWPTANAFRVFDHRNEQSFSLRPIMPDSDAATLYRWYATEHAKFWFMPDKSEAGIRACYEEMQKSCHARAFLGLAKDQAAFVIECYDPALDRLADHYPVVAGDLGMHLFIAPATIRIPKFTRDAFRFSMLFMFQELKALRIVVEPDINNNRIHILNQAMGFRTIGRASFPEKEATIAVCASADFAASQLLEAIP